MGAVKEEYTVIQELCWEAYADGCTDVPAVRDYVSGRYPGPFQITNDVITPIWNQIQNELTLNPEDIYV